MDKNKVIESAAKLIAKGQLDKAAKEFQRALEVDPDDVRILQKLAELDQKMGRHTEAADCFERVAKTYASQGFYLKAVALYKQVLKVVERIEVNVKLAELYQQLGLIGDATKEWQNVASYYEKIGDLKASLDTLKKLVDLDPDNVAARIRLGEQYARQDNFVEAVTELRRAAEYLKRNGRTDDYLRVAERISHLDQGDAALARELAESYLARGDSKRALAKLQICFKANPRDLQTLQMLARAFQELGQINKTVSVLKELARLHFDAQRFEDAQSVFEQVAELAPDDGDVKASLRQIAFQLQGPQSRQDTTPGTPIPAALRNSAPGRASASATPPKPPPKSSPTLQAAPISPSSAGSARGPSSKPPAPVSRPPTPAARAPAPSAPPPPNTSPGSMAPSSPSSAVPKLLKETDVYVKYGLHEKALDHLARIFSLDPDSTEAHEKAKTLALAMKRPAAAMESLARLVKLYSARSDPRADACKAELRKLDPKHPALQLSANLSVVSEGRSPFDEKTNVDAPRRRASSAFDLGASESGEITVAEVLHHLDTSGPLPVPRSPPPGEFPLSNEPAANGPITQPIDRSVYAAEAIAELDEQESALVEEVEPVLSQEKRHAAAIDALRDEDAFAADLAEADFYVDAGLAEDARAILEGILLAEPDHEGANKRLAALGASPEEEAKDESLRTLLDARPVPKAIASDADSLAAELAAELASEVADLAVAADDAPIDAQRIEAMSSTSEITGGGLRSQVQEAIRREDAQTHYDLGIAYKEMGLLDDAIAEFELALQFGGGVRKIDCIVILAVCAMEKGKPQDAVAVLRRSLEEPGLNPPALRALAYELGQAYEALGDRQQALEQYKAIERSERGFRDVAARIQRLGGTISAPIAARPKTGPIQTSGQPSGAAGARPGSGRIPFDAAGSTGARPASGRIFSDGPSSVPPAAGAAGARPASGRILSDGPASAPAAPAPSVPAEPSPSAPTRPPSGRVIVDPSLGAHEPLDPDEPAPGELGASDDDALTQPQPGTPEEISVRRNRKIGFI